MPKQVGSHLTYEDKCPIHAYLKSGKSNYEIAKLIGCSHTAINKEVKHNQGKRAYRSKQVHEFSLTRRLRASCQPKKMTAKVVELIRRMLSENQWSPIL